jgi:hypothetical protein
MAQAAPSFVSDTRSPRGIPGDLNLPRISLDNCLLSTESLHFDHCPLPIATQYTMPYSLKGKNVLVAAGSR